MTQDDKTPTKAFPRIGEDLTRPEIMEVLADEGYSASGRKGWLKTVLTELSKAQQQNPDEARAELVSEITDILDDNISGEPKADDTL